MTDSEQARRPGAEPIAAVLADRVRELREGRGLSQADLAARMAELGTPWKRATVVNLEKRGTTSRGSSGVGRDAVTLQEWLHLALVLNVPPPWLLADPRVDAPVPIAEGVDLGAWEALLWLIGSSTVDDGIASHPQSSRPLDLIWHGRIVAEAAGVIGRTPVWMIDKWREYPAGMQLRVAGVSGDDPEGQHRAVDDLHREQLETIREALTRIIDLGARPPQVGEKVLHRAAELDVKLPGQDGEG